MSTSIIPQSFPSRFTFEETTGAKRYCRRLSYCPKNDPCITCFIALEDDGEHMRPCVGFLEERMLREKLLKAEGARKTNELKRTKKDSSSESPRSKKTKIEFKNPPLAEVCASILSKHKVEKIYHLEDIARKHTRDIIENLMSIDNRFVLLPSILPSVPPMLPPPFPLSPPVPSLSPLTLTPPLELPTSHLSPIPEEEWSLEEILNATVDE
mmetsp:Transcript_3730/g.5663  ORF Transcript_3730/g.5663 Transcript_3730/m.5663 type:complete len:211 (+) Transcript_3730:396-1028(+)